MGTFVGIVIGLLIGALVTWLVVRRPPAVPPGEYGSAGQAVTRADLARAWQEGYDAGSAAVDPAPAGPADLHVPVMAPAQATPPSWPAASVQPPGPVLPAAPPTALPAPPPARPVAWSGPAAASATPATPAAPGIPVAPTGPPPLVPPATPEELAAAKDRRDRRNVNITLYTACFLLVAAASLFIGAALPATARVVGLAVVVGLFYGGGLVVHALSRTLRPAAAAFTGTGLALVPVAGVALDSLVLQQPALSWLLTSAVGTAMMVVAAVRLDSRVVAFLTVPFLLSTVMASGAAVQQGMVWALIASIGLAVLMAWLSVDAEIPQHAPDQGGATGSPGTAALGTVPSTPRTRWLPAAYRTAIAHTHQWIVPGTILAGLVIGVWLAPVQMFLLLLAACAYYATVAVIGPPRHRLAASYAVRIGLFAAVVPGGLMVGASTGLVLTVLVAYLCAQVPLVWWGSPRAQGHLPTGEGRWIDHGVSWVLALALAVADQSLLVWEGRPGIGLAAALLGTTTAVCSVLFVRSTRVVDSGAPGAANLVWQATTPVSLLPLLVQPAGGGTRGWALELVLGATLLVQAVILAVLARHGQRHRLDARIAPHLMAAAAVALVYLLAGRLWDTADARGGTTTANGTPWPALLTAAAALAWATVTALRGGPLAGVRPAEPSRAPGVPVTVWSAATLLALLLMVGLSVDSAAVVAGWYVLAAVTGAVSWGWLTRGDRPAPRGDTSAPALPVLVVAVAVLVLAAATLRLSAVHVLPGGDGGPGPWHLVAALALTTGWLVAAAALTRDRLPRTLRAGLLLAGQAMSAVLVSTVVDRLGGDGSAARAAAAATLAAGMAVRSRFARSPQESVRTGAGGWLDALSGPTAAWLVTAVLGGLWVLEVGLGGDRAALLVIALAAVAAGLVLGTARGGQWVELAAAVAMVLAASDRLGLTGGWLPQALLPGPAAVAVLLLLAVGVLAWEILAARSGAAGGPANGTATTERGTEGNGGPTDLAVFRPAAVVVLWGLGVLLGILAGPGRGPQDGALGTCAAVAAVGCYVFARTRGTTALTVGTVLAVPAAVGFLQAWARHRAPWFPDEVWAGVLLGVVSGAVLGAWALADARRPGPRPLPAVLWQGGLAVLLVAALATVLDGGTPRTPPPSWPDLPAAAGTLWRPEDVVVWTACGLLVLGAWLTVDAWGRTLLWPATEAGRAAWIVTGRDAAVLATFAAVSRAWWQTAAVEDGGQAAWWNLQVLVIVLAGLGFHHVHRRTGGGPPERQFVFFVAAATVFTLAAVLVLVGGTAAMQLTVLIGFALLVVLGLTRREQSLTWWGAGGVALSVLWYLRGYTYVYLALLGLVLIVLAVRQLRRHQARQALNPTDDPPGHPTGHPSGHAVGHPSGNLSGPAHGPAAGWSAEHAAATGQPPAPDRPPTQGR